MFDSLPSKRSAIEPLEARIAPASAVASAHWVTATFGAPIALHAGDGLGTAGANAGTYLLYVEKGDALVFVTDLNNNGDVEFNEITGIAAGDGLSLISFVDIHGDIATNLLKTTAVISGTLTTKFSLTDSDNNHLNDPLQVGDGRILQNSTIEKIELRALTIEDLSGDQNGDGFLDGQDVIARTAYSTFSIFGNIYAGKGFGVAGGGLIIDDTGGAGNFGFTVHPTVGSIKTGTAASGSFFSYGVSNADDTSGTFLTFSPLRGQAGGDIIGVRATNTFSIDGLFAGDGGIGARGGNIQDVVMNGDDVGGYRIVAGNGGRGPSGGVGGSILGFSDLNSHTGKVVITSGSGGGGATGAGGNAGNLSFDTFNVFGNVNITLGSGGDGFTAGGNGASLTKGLFDQPLAAAVDPGNGYGTMHQSVVDGDLLTAGFQPQYVPTLGTNLGVDFDGDGNGDFVYTSKSNSQVAVMFGNGGGGFRTIPDPDGGSTRDRIYFSAVRNPEALIVTDLNADGHPDIAVGSQDTDSHAGIVVFLAKYEDTTGDGLSSQEDLNHNGIDDFLGFHDARYSVLPQLQLGDPQTGNAFLPFWQGPTQVSSLTAGDYDGDGKVELAAVVTYYAQKVSDTVTGITSSLSQPTQVVLYLTPDVEFDNVKDPGHLNPPDLLTGQFYADFGTKAAIVNGVNIPPAPRYPFFVAASGFVGGDLVVETTALTTVSDHDVIIVGVKNSTLFKSARTVDYQVRDNGTILPPVPFVAGTYSYGKVDVNRDLSDPGKADKKDLQDVLLQDFVVADVNADGIADLGVISSSPAGFLVGVVGNGLGFGSQDSGSDGTAAHPYPNGPGGFGNNPNDNQGNFFGSKGTGAGDNIIAIRAMDADADGNIDDFVVLQGTGSISRMMYQSGPQPTDPVPGTTSALQPTGAIELLGFFHRIGATELNEYFLAIHLPNPTNPSNPFYAVGTDSNGALPIGGAQNTVIHNNVDGTVFTRQPLLENGLKLSSGDGGDSLIGKGGAGGNLGSGSKVAQTIDIATGLPVTDLVGSVQINVSGTIRVFAGNGGDGFSTGGKGGSISGVVLRPLLSGTTIQGVTATLVAGDGGRGIASAGGAGGDLTENSIVGGRNFLAGDGGPGRIGGAGGDVLGNKTNVFDADLGLNSTVGSLTVIAGNGGAGITRGGAGGNILNFSPIAGVPSVESGTLQYTAGDGGDAVSGAGGNGGNVINSSPKPGDGIQFEFLVEGGDGGDGTKGGDGGDVVKFISRPAANSKKAESFSFLGGRGGDGTSGNGGRGGDVMDVSVPSRGTVSLSAILTNFGYPRVLAGDGGSSSVGKGGDGGDVVNLNTGTSGGTIAIVSGAGGSGLTSGGAGGDIRNTELFMAASTVSKALVVAGAGGKATAFIPNANDPGSPNQPANAFGGKIGIGGNGGNIVGFHQFGSIGPVIDLISGDGGDTVNYGSVLDKKGYGGKGGSIQGVKVEGDIGAALDPFTAIKSYNDILTGETMQAWVNGNIRTNPAAIATLNNSDGNVGIVVGIAGRSKAVVTMAGADPANPASYTVLPSRDVPNGSLIDVEARNIMSAVAGNVDRIASIQVVKSLRVVGGIIGADKPAFPGDTTNTKNYLDPTGAPIIGHPVRDGRLVDGAVVAKVIYDATGKFGTLPSDRVFIL